MLYFTSPGQNQNQTQMFAMSQDSKLNRKRQMNPERERRHRSIFDAIAIEASAFLPQTGHKLPTKRSALRKSFFEGF